MQTCNSQLFYYHAAVETIKLCICVEDRNSFKGLCRVDVLYSHIHIYINATHNCIDIHKCAGSVISK